MGGTRGDSGKVEYILTKLETRIAKSRTFLVKVKTHRGEPLNEGADDLSETGRVMEKEGKQCR
jgi:ribonuclease HI